MMRMIDGNEAVAHVAYRVNEMCVIYPITPSSPMGELADQWASEGRPNLWGTVPHVAEMQSEGGAAGAVHGALQTGALTTTFTASQGLLLMMPNMFKIAGELTSAVFHVAARSVAAQALSIFGDHSDVMATRSTGFAQLCSASVQEAHDMALVAQAATLESRIPFLHFFDGFRTSHEINKIEMLGDEQIRAMIDDDLVAAHRRRALSPDHPVVRGTAQNPDVFFQARETVNPFYEATPGIVARLMERFGALTGRPYRAFEYFGHREAERVIVLMGSGVGAAREAVEYLNREGARLGLVQVRLFRPFSVTHFLEALPPTASRIAVLDRTKEPGATGEPLYQDVVTALAGAAGTGSLAMPSMPRVVGGRYGLSSKEFTPAMVKAVFDELVHEAPRSPFTVGIRDDVGGLSLEVDPAFEVEPDDVYRAVFFGLGADGTVGANKNSIKIIGEEEGRYAQGFFVYDSKKSGSRTASHLRFGPRPIHSTYLIASADFVGVHQAQFLEQHVDVLGPARRGAVLLLNTPHPAERVWRELPLVVQREILEKELEVYAIDAYRVAGDAGLGTRINTIMQTCFFAITDVIPTERAILEIKRAIEKSYARKGPEVVARNHAAVDAAVAALHRVPIPRAEPAGRELPPVVPLDAPDFVREVTAAMMAGKGDRLPVSALPPDGTYPSGTAAWEKRNVSQEVPIWEPDICIQCGNCSFVCPHSVIRATFYPESALEGAPEGFKSAPLAGRGFPGARYTLQVSVEDCTGCRLCIDVCPAKSKEAVGVKAINMGPKAPVLEAERESLAFFDTLPKHPPHRIDTTTVRGVQYLTPLFEYSGACAGCGETPYLKLLTQLFGDRAVIANATGCSSIFGGNLPTTPWTTDENGRGPAWSNSLFEDNAEFGLGFRLSIDKQHEYAAELLGRLVPELDGVADEILGAPQRTAADIETQRGRVARLKAAIADREDPESRALLSVADTLVRRSVWIVGGDGWAYDIGYGGLDHVLASGRDVNVLVLDTEVYSNTGGQASKATPRAAVAKFAAGGKQVAKKDLGLMAIAYGDVYVAQVAMGAMDRQTIRAFMEAEAYDGPSLIIAYAHCIAHGINMEYGLRQQKRATDSGYWPLYRYQPNANGGGGRFTLDSAEPSIPLKEYAYNEIRYRMLSMTNAEEARRLLQLAEQDVRAKLRNYRDLAARGAD